MSVQEARKQVGEHKPLLSRQIDPAEQRQKKSDISLAVFALEYSLSSSWHRTLRGKSLQKKLARIHNSDYGSKHLKQRVQTGMERMPQGIRDGEGSMLENRRNILKAVEPAHNSG